MPDRSAHVDVLLVASEAECFTAAHQQFPTLAELTLPSGTVIHTGSMNSVERDKVRIALIRPSNEVTAAVTKEVLTALRPNYTLYLGLAHTIDERLRPGDVVVARKIYSIEHGEEGRVFKPRPRAYHPAHRLEQRALAEACRFEWRQFGKDLPTGDDAPNAFVEPIASGRTQLQRNAPALKWLRGAYADTVAVMLAGDDFSSANHVDNIETAVICAISSDLVKGRVRAPAVAARAAVAFAVSMITRLGPDPGNPNRPVVDEPLIDTLSEFKRDLSLRLTKLHRERICELRGDASKQTLARISAEIDEVRKQLRTGPQLCVGDVLGDRYKLEKVIGSGGFATVYRAFDWYDREDVAVKVLHANRSDDEEVRSRFLRGARSMAALAGSGAVRVTDIGGSDRGYYYFAMELMNETFRSMIESVNLSLRRRLNLVLEVGHTLAAAHDLGIVHRDIRPDNILISNTRARLTDFDIARMPEATRYTTTNSMGTFTYSAPEQLHTAHEATVLSDIYSLAMVTVYAITREDPDPAEFQQDRYAYIEALSCPRDIQRVLARALALRPRDRYYACAADFCNDLQKCLPDNTVTDVQNLGQKQLSQLRLLCDLPDPDFERQVAAIQVEDPLWKSRRGSRMLRAVELLLYAPQAGVALPGTTISPSRRPPTTNRSYKYAEFDWERVHEILCACEPDEFDAFLMAFPYTMYIEGPYTPRIHRVAGILREARRDQDSQVSFGLVREFARNAVLDSKRIMPATARARSFWARERLKIALAELNFRLSAESPGASHPFSQTSGDPPSALAADDGLPYGDYRPLKEYLATVERTLTLSSLRWAGRVHTLVREAESAEQHFSAQRCCSHPPTRHFEVYVALCDLEETEWCRIREDFIVPCAAPELCSRAVQVRSFLELVTPWACDELAARLGNTRPVPLVIDRPLYEGVSARSAYFFLPDDLQAELSIYLGFAPHPHQTTPNSIFEALQIAFPEERIIGVCAELHRIFVHSCTVKSVGFPTSLPSTEEAEVTRLYRVLQTSTFEEIFNLWPELNIPKRYVPPPETPFGAICFHLAKFLHFVNIPGCIEIKNTGTTTDLFHWLRGQRRG